MSDTKLRPEDLTSEERAIVDNAALFYRRVTGAVGETAEWAYVEALKEAEPIILARRALFAPAPEKAAKVETMADRIAADLKAGTFRGEQPAPPEPAAREMPEAVRDAVDTLRSGVPSYPTWRQYADTLESWWRNLAQPVAAGMTEELEHVLSIAERDLRYKEECFDNSARTVHDERIERLRAAIAAVREQFGNGRKVECPNCGEMTEHNHSRYEGPGPDKWACQPAPPEPAAICSPEWDKRVHSSAAKIALATAGMTTPPEPAAPSWMKVSCLGDVDAGKEDLLCPPPDPKSCWICRQHEEHCCPQPEPTAREMPEAVHEAANYLRQEARYETDPQVRLHSQKTMRAATLNAAADALEREWRNLAQPVAVGMTEELADLLDSIMAFADADPDTPVKQIWRKKVSAVREQAAQPVAVGMTEALRMILDVAESRAEDQRHDGLLECSRNLERAIAAVRQQAAQGRKVELGKVRAYFNTPSALRTVGDERAALAEIDAAEGKGEGRG